MSKRRALVIGGSVGGLFVALLLRAAGFDVAVFERAAGDLGDRGTGIGTRDELFAVMRRLGLATDASARVEGRTGLERDGATLLELAMPAVTGAWSRIWRPLRAALPAGCYHAGMTLAGVESDATGVTAHFADGSRQRGDLLIGADGLHSTVRASLLPDLKPGYAGYVAWRGVIDERAVEPSWRELLFRRMVFGFGERELMLSIPMPGDGNGRRCHFVWFRAVGEASLADLCTDATGRQHGVAIPPPLIRPDLIRALITEAAATLAPQLSALVEATPQIILQPIFDLQSPRIVFGRIALIGDAAFVARPHVASGVMKAALDAQALADALAADEIDPALARYEAKRQPYGAWLVARGRRIGEYFATAGGDRRERIERLMTEYGTAGLVDRTPISARL
jgi:2-polyprenyl-6-methoxyphenol hydroxylase-like FAD-dependent oxidoreductase